MPEDEHDAVVERARYDIVIPPVERRAVQVRHLRSVEAPFLRGELCGAGPGGECAGDVVEGDRKRRERGRRSRERRREEGEEGETHLRRRRKA